MQSQPIDAVRVRNEIAARLMRLHAILPAAEALRRRRRRGTGGAVLMAATDPCENANRPLSTALC